MYIYKWINPITYKEEILGTLIETKTLSAGGHGEILCYTFDSLNHINEFSNNECNVSHNKRNQLIIKGYSGMGMNFKTGLYTIKCLN